MYSYRADFGWTNNLWEHTGCTVIVLILNKQMIYESTMDVQVIVLILNFKKIMGAWLMYSYIADFE